jgi:hypothetical protein
LKLGRLSVIALFVVVAVLALAPMWHSSAQAAHGVGLKWTLSTTVGVAGQNVYRATVSGGPYTKLTATALAPTVAAYLDPVVDGVTYFYVVTAISQGPIVIESVFSNQVSAAAPGPAPNPQTALAATAQ